MCNRGRCEHLERGNGQYVLEGFRFLEWITHLPIVESTCLAKRGAVQCDTDGASPGVPTLAMAQEEQVAPTSFTDRVKSVFTMPIALVFTTLVMHSLLEVLLRWSQFPWAAAHEDIAAVAFALDAMVASDDGYAVHMSLITCLTLGTSFLTVLLFLPVVLPVQLATALQHSESQRRPAREQADAACPLLPHRARCGEVHERMGSCNYSPRGRVGRGAF